MTLATFSEFLGHTTTVAYVVLGFLAFLQWQRQRTRQSGWLAATFLVLGVVLLVAEALPETPRTDVQMLVGKFVIAVLLLFPIGLFMGMAFPIGMQLAAASHAPPSQKRFSASDGSLKFDASQALMVSAFLTTDRPGMLAGPQQDHGGAEVDPHVKDRERAVAARAENQPVARGGGGDGIIVDPEREGAEMAAHSSRAR